MEICKECSAPSKEIFCVNFGLDKEGCLYTHEVCEKCADLIFGYPDNFGKLWEACTSMSTLKLKAV